MKAMFARVGRAMSAIAFMLLMALATPVQSQTLLDGEGVLGWMTYAPGGARHYFASPQAACYAQYTLWSAGGTFQGADPDPVWWSWQCKWTGVPYPVGVEFKCAAGYTVAAPGRCIRETYASRPPGCGLDSGPLSPLGGNPVEIISGIKTEYALDFASADGLLKLERKYFGMRTDASALPDGILPYGGIGWAFDFGPTLRLWNFSVAAGRRVSIFLADGTAYEFVLNASTGLFEYLDPASRDKATRTRFALTLDGPPPANWANLNTASSEWTLVDRFTGKTYEFKTLLRPAGTSYSWGFTEVIRDRGGYAWTITHGSDTEVTAITNSFGRQMTFSWLTGKGGTSVNYKILISGITLPDGTSLKYSYENYLGTLFSARTQWDRLVKVERLGAPVGGGAAPLYGQTIYHYEDGRFPFLMTGITDARGERYATWTYDASGKVLTSSHAGVDTVSFAYASPTATTRTRTLTNPLGRQTVYSYTASTGDWILNSVAGQATTNCPASSGTYTVADKMVATRTDEEGRVSKYVRDASGMPTTVTEAFGTPDARTTTNTWRSDRQIDLTVKPGLTTDYVYDSEGLLSSVVETDTTTHTLPYATSGQTRTRAYTYTTEGLLASVDGPLPGTGDTVNYAYDANGYLASVTNELGHVTTITSVDAVGRPLGVTDANGIATVFTYSPLGFLETVTVDPSGVSATTTIGYDGIGQVTSISTEDGASFTYVYDAARRLTSTTDAKGNVLSYGHDAMGNVTLTEIDNSASTLLYSQTQTFDELGRLLTSVGVGSATWRYNYDKVSNLKGATDPRNNTQAYAYNRLNELIETVDEVSQAVDLERNAQGEVVGHTDPRLIETQYVRNGWGEVIEETSPDIGAVVYERDARGEITKRTDAKGQVRNYTYDVAGRLTAISYPGSAGEDATFTYDDVTGGNLGIGRLTGFANPAGDTRRVYNSLGLLASERLDGFGLVRTTSYQYDAAGNIQGMVYPSGRVVTFNRDLQGTITGISTQTTVSDPVIELAQAITWQPFGAGIAGLTFGNGLEWQRSYDLNYRLTQQKLLDGVTPLMQRSYSYGDNLNLTAVTDDLAPAKNESYGYSPNNMLTAASGPWGADTFSYDGVGNITSHVNVLGGVTTDNQAGYAPTANHMAGIVQNGSPVRSFTYDANGNVETDTVLGVATTYRYNHADRMYAVERGGLRLGEYYYNVSGQLVLRIVTNTMPSGWTMYFYDQEGQLIAEYDGVSGALLREYVWLEDTPVAVIEAGATPTIHYIHTDHIGRPIALTDASGSFVNETTWVVFGNAWSVTGTVGVDLRFPGQMYQYESALHYNWNRQYDPSIARYTQPDPLGLVDGPSRYAYVRNDPLQRVDPQGLQIVLPFPLPPPPMSVPPSSPGMSIPPLPPEVSDAIEGFAFSCVSILDPKWAFDLFPNRIRRMSDRELDAAARANGYKDAHDMKRRYGFGGETDIYRDKDGNMYGVDRGGGGNPEDLGIGVDGH